MKPQRMTETQRAELLRLLKSVPELAELHEAVRLHFMAEYVTNGEALPMKREGAHELLSVWYNRTDSTTRIGSRPSLLPDLEGWGYLLAAIARNVSERGLEGLDAEESLRRIRVGLDKGWENEPKAPTEVH